MSKSGASIAPTVQYKLEKDTELRFEIEVGEKVCLRLNQGHAEVFGSELLPHFDYVLPELSKVAVFTWHGCVLQLTGKPEVAYIVTKTPMWIYLNSHAGLEQVRDESSNKQVRGPCVMVVGPANSGMSSICRLLVNYAVRLNRKPLYIDLDVDGNDVGGVPGTLGALLVERPGHVVTGFNIDHPLLYHFGHTHPGTNPEYYNHCISRLARVADKKFASDPVIDVSGCIINTHSWAKEDGVRSLSHVAQEFEVGVILVVESERLFADLRRVMPEFVRMILLPKSGGVVEKNREHRTKDRFRKVHEYFYGPSNKFYPFSFDINSQDVKIFKVGAPELPASLLPLGMKQDDSKKKLVPTSLSKSLLNHLLSVSLAASEEQVTDCNLAGFLVITAINLEKGSFTVISPEPRPMPFKYLLLNDTLHLEMV